MSVDPTVSFGFAPLQTPISTPEGRLSTPWAAWVNQVGKLVKQAPTISNVASKMVPDSGGALATDYSPEAWKQWVYYQTDTGLVYISMIVSNTWQWHYAAGAVTVATLAALPATLTTLDTGLIAYETQYFHAYQWTGAVWRFLPGDPGAKYIVAGEVAPKGGKWQLCDGTTVAVSNGDGTTTNVVTPNLNTGGYSGGPVLVGGGGTGFQGAAASSWQAAAKTDTEAAHTHPITATVTVQSGAGATPAATGNTGAGTSHSHNLSDANAKLKIPSDAADATHGGGMPDRYYLNWYMRQ